MTGPSADGKTAIKFCGLSQPDDVEAVNDIHPEYVGFVFWPRSKRFLTANEASELRALLDDDILTVGVFVDEDIDDIVQLVRRGIISVVQLHGTEDEGYLRELSDSLSDSTATIWKAFEVGGADDIRRANDSSADFVLLDGGKGEGKAFPWELLELVERPFGLAGGLDADNVAEALSSCSPSLVDVSSAIEGEASETGGPHKDPALMRRFAENIRMHDEMARASREGIR